MEFFTDATVLRAPTMILAWLVAFLAAFVALDLIGRAGRARRRLATGWLMGAALGLGTGIWAVHVIGLSAQALAFEMAPREGQGRAVVRRSNLFWRRMASPLACQTRDSGRRLTK